MSEKTILSHREWLNPSEGTAFVAAEVVLDQFTNKQGELRSHIYAALKFADCNRVVELDLDFDNDEQFAERIEKLKRVKRAVNEAQRALETVRDLMDNQTEKEN